MKDLKIILDNDSIRIYENTVSKRQYKISKKSMRIRVVRKNNKVAWLSQEEIILCGKLIKKIKEVK